MEPPTYAELAALVVELRAEVAELKRQVAGNSKNSSRPPSSDGLAKAPPKSLRERSGRKPGGQAGHPGGHLAKAQIPDEVILHPVLSCGRCDASLAGSVVLEPLRRQVLDLPQVGLSACEHVAERRRCVCGHQSTADFPAGVSAPVQYGPRIRALGIYLVARQHLPYDRAAQLFFDWFGVRISTGTLVAFVAQGAKDLQPFLDEVHRQITTAPVVGFDETGARVNGKLHWLHTASTPTLTFFALHQRRGSEGIDHAGILPAFTGTAMHDGYTPYRKYPAATHALCNAHHLRELCGVIEQDTAATQSWAGQMDQLLRDLHRIVLRQKATGHQDLQPFQLAQVRAAYTQIIARGHRENPPPTIRTGRRGPIRKSVALNLLTRLDRDREHVLRFAHDFEVPFDNNQAERDIRMIKIQQKISGCWRTLSGADAFLALRAYISTSGKQGQHPLHALTRLATGDAWLPAT